MTLASRGRPAKQTANTVRDLALKSALQWVSCMIIGGMRNILCLIVMTILPVVPVLAQPSGGQKPGSSANSGKLLPMKREGGSNACATYGLGFAKVEGTDTCVKIGGAVSIGVGSSGDHQR